MNRLQQDLLRRIVLPPDVAAAMPRAKNMPRIGAALGSYWFHQNQTGNSENDTQKEKDPDKNNEGQDDNGDDANDPRKNPTQTPKQGESITGLTDLHDCSTGRGVNVNFTIPPKAPDGWEDVCKPPSEPADPKYVYYIRLHLSPYNPRESMRKAEYYLTSKKHVASRVIAWYGADKDVEYGSNRAGTDITAYVNEYMDRYTSGISYILGNHRIRPKSDSHKSYWWGNPTALVHIERMERNKLPAGVEVEQPPKRLWDEKTPAEIVSTPTGFAAACGDDIDPNLPLVFKGGQQPTGFALCDKDGNEVVIERTPDGGWQYSTASHTVRLDKNGKVVDVVVK